jgi:hypothetical protein
MNWQEAKELIKECAYLEALNNDADWEELFAITHPEWDQVNASILMNAFDYEIKMYKIYLEICDMW